MKPDPAALCYSGLQTGMALAVFNEVAERLAALATQGAVSAIDLRSMPLTEAGHTDDAAEEPLGRDVATAVSS